MKENSEYVYYAHSKKIYDTQEEKDQIEFIEKVFENRIFNPKTELIWNRLLSMEPYFDAVRNSSAVVCSEYMHHIGKGVYSEIKVALENNIPVYCIQREDKLENSLYSVQIVLSIETVDVNDWSIYYGRISECQ